MKIANETGQYNLNLNRLAANGFYMQIEWVSLAMKIESSSIAPQARIV
jgi:hypothetical protein